MIVYETEWCGMEYARFFTNKAEAIRFAKQRVRDDETDARVDIVWRSEPSPNIDNTRN